MKRFEFKLQSLLKFRNHLERMAQQEMAQVLLEITDCEKQIDSLQTTHGQWVQKLEHLVVKGIGSQEFKRHQDYLGALLGMVEEETKRKVQLETLLEKKRLALKKRSIDKKAIERLREKQAEEFKQEMLVAEQKELDEISSLKVARELSNETHQ
jgi:flagellar FliJ protein